MKKKILVVIEDDEFLRELIVSKLKKENYDVFEAIDGEMGIEEVKKQRPDLVLLDLILPGISGFEVLSQIKTDSTLSSTPVIICSNLGQMEDVKKCLEIGANDYIIKAHFTPNEIVNIIKKYI